MNTIIGLSGKKGSGKDTIADFLASEYNYRLHDHADPIRKAFDAVVGPKNTPYRTERNLKETTVPGFAFSYRNFAEAFGSGGMMGQLDPSWALGAAEAAFWKGGKICFTNLRHPDEITHIRIKCKAEIWWIDRPNNPYSDDSDALTEEDYSHLADIIVPNAGTINELYNWIRSRL